MKKLLLASVATLAIAAFAAGQAQAADAKNEGLKLGVGGYMSVQGAVANQDDGAGQPGLNKKNGDLFQYGEINLTAEKAFDNGLSAGYKGVLMIPTNNTGTSGGTNPTVTIRQSYGYFTGNWGRLEAGQNYSPTYYMAVNAPNANESFDSLDPDFNLVNITSSTAGNTASSSTVTGQVGNGGAVTLGTNGDTVFTTGQIAGNGNYATTGATPFYKSGGLLGDKVVYYTPRFNGFQLGGAFQPSASRTGDNTKSATSGFVASNTTKQQDDRYDIAASYTGKYQGVGVKVGGGYAHATKAAADLANAGATGRDQESYTGGAQLSYMNWTLGGGYLWDNNGQSFRSVTNSDSNGTTAGGSLVTQVLTADGETKTWNAGLGYGVGPYRAGVSYFDTEVDVLRATGVSGTAAQATSSGVGAFSAYKSTDKLKRWVIGGGYAVAPGVDLNTSLQFHKYETDRASSNASGNNDATVFTVGTTMNF